MMTVRYIYWTVGEAIINDGGCKCQRINLKLLFTFMLTMVMNTKVLLCISCPGSYLLDLRGETFYEAAFALKAQRSGRSGLAVKQ